MTKIGVIVMDDDPDQLEIIRIAIERTGHTNYELYLSDKLLVEHLTNKIHVYIIDHKITGGRTGLEVLRLIKRENKSSFVIAYTGYSSDPKLIIDYMNAGCQRWVRKDADLSVLEYCINEGLEEAQKQIDFATLMEQERAEPLHGKVKY